jgi:hypothetical protein
MSTTPRSIFACPAPPITNPLDAYEAEVYAWARSARLERPDGGPVLHKLQGTPPAGDKQLSEGGERAQRALEGNPHVFVIQHDWAAAFAGSTEPFDERPHLPYPHCYFEFKISGRRVGAIVLEEQGDLRFLIYVQHSRASGAWICLSRQYNAVTRLVMAQVNAICVALDAGIAESERVPASKTLNKIRVRRGDRPIADYHVINLARRARSSAKEISEPSDRRAPRLHFRRGHWRHYDDHKTWINWTLVGDPDLGFIEKHYRL